MSSTWTLWTLPAQPAPGSAVVYPTFVTILAFICVAFALFFHLKLSGSTLLWPEFKSIRGSTMVLAVWYTGTAVDRWLHFNHRALPNGYILFEPMLQSLRVISTIWFLWALTTSCGRIWSGGSRASGRRACGGLPPRLPSSWSAWSRSTTSCWTWRRPWCGCSF
ncbi:hypothetical protein B0T26DRAFT_453996 [Lasiosphaeria miniovina]|uniref:Uncharacterized protein n=1 Tax=Lasiosphaeria miniovina TaxID=1954250 RepID=A0AA39ZZB2_9PEZI|nr:uncharacterized protein B0T26DRAFT_453996 [Lasiosphaeria miniovina]KAK0706433.1 hypothetical protein B0T26DRAFT_453996 [Lasiosphaeria miniovina]